MAPAECLAEVDEPIEASEAAPERQPPCLHPDANEWIACMVAKARELARLKEIDRGSLKVERERRRACATFIRSLDEPTPGAPPSALEH